MFSRTYLIMEDKMADTIVKNEIKGWSKEDFLKSKEGEKTK